MTHERLEAEAEPFKTRIEISGAKGLLMVASLNKSYKSKKILKLHTKSIKGSATRFRVNDGKILDQSWRLKP